VSELKPLSKKHQRVLDEYLLCFSQVASYQKVYPKATYDSAKALASNLFTDVNFSAHLISRLNEAHMSADEALKLTADIARGDVSQFINPFGGIDVDRVRANGKLIKKIRTRTITKIGKTDKDEDTEITDTEIELYPADAAIERILKIHGKFTDRVDLTNSDGSLKPEEMKPSEIAARVAALLKDKDADNA
jgi:hypothetical protein